MWCGADPTWSKFAHRDGRVTMFPSSVLSSTRTLVSPLLVDANRFRSHNWEQTLASRRAFSPRDASPTVLARTLPRRVCAEALPYPGGTGQRHPTEGCPNMRHGRPAQSVLSSSSSEAELMQYRSPVGRGPSLNTWPRCDSHSEHVTSVLTIPNPRSTCSPTGAPSMGA